LSTSKNALLVFMSKRSRKFKVPDEMANLYDFANTLDLRRFTHRGVQHLQRDTLTSPQELAAWMSERGLSRNGQRVTPAMLATALDLRANLRAFLQADPKARRSDAAMLRALTRATSHFPLVAATLADGKLALMPAGHDAIAGLATVVAEMHNAALSGKLDRLKMCASEECRHVFFDRSKPASRRWCLSTLCGNRAKTRNYRERHQEA
jgi:predicted RNA-binding Zn ribbon-like protein